MAKKKEVPFQESLPENYDGSNVNTLEIDEQTTLPPVDLFVDESGDNGLETKPSVPEEFVGNEHPIEEDDLLITQEESEPASYIFAKKALGIQDNDGIVGKSRSARYYLSFTLGNVKEVHDTRPRNSVTDAKFNQIVAQTQKLNALIIQFLNSK